MLFKSKKFGLEKKTDLVKNAKPARKFFPNFLLIVLGILMGVGGTFLYIQKMGVPFGSILLNNSTADNNAILLETVKKVGKLIVLPKDETPAMATIKDADLLIKNEPFYLGSKNGDVVLMYQKALKAVIYSPERNIIVNVGPVYMPPADANTQTPVDSTKATSSVVSSATSSSTMNIATKVKSSIASKATSSPLIKK